MKIKRDNFNNHLSKGISRRSFLKGTLISGATSLVLPAFPNIIRAKAKEVKIGVMYPMSGGLAEVGKVMTRGVQMACDEINQAGGIKSLGGANLIPIIADTEGKPEVGMSAAEKLVQEGVSCLYGCFQSGVTFVTTQVAEKHKTPHIVALATSDDIVTRGFKYTFRIIAPVSRAAKDQTDFVVRMGEKTGKKAKTAAVLYENSLFGQTASRFQKLEAQKAGFEIVEEISYPATALDLTSEISKLKAKAPDVVYRTTYLKDAILITKTMCELKFHCMCQMGFAGETILEYLRILGPLSNYMYAILLWTPRSKIPMAAAADERYKKRYGTEMDNRAAAAYQPVYMLKKALETTGSTDREALRNALSKIDIKMGEEGNIMPYGVKFDERGQNIVSYYPIGQNVDGATHIVYPEIVASKSPVWPATDPCQK